MPDQPFLLAVASGKGGTGKTLVATNVAMTTAAKNLSHVVLADCDVEAPNDHLFLEVSDPVTVPVEVPVAEADSARCDGCGECRNACAYGAIRVLGESAVVFEELCHGCGVCTDVCVRRAIAEVPRRVGEVAVGPVSGRPDLSLVTGSLDIAQVKAPSVIRAVRENAARIASDGAGNPTELVVFDAPPGVACSAVSTVNGTDALLLVTEPTPFGIHDLELSLRLARSLALPTGIVINRDRQGSVDIERLSAEFSAPVVARIPFDRRIAEVYARGDLLAEEFPEIAAALGDLPRRMREIAAEARTRTAATRPR